MMPRKRLLAMITSALILALIFLGISHYATREPWGASTGYPILYSHPNLPCTQPNTFNGCGYSYDPVLVGLDYLFWLTIALAVIFTTYAVETLFVSPPQEIA